MEIKILNQFLKNTQNLKQLSAVGIQISQPLEGNFVHLESLDISVTNITVQDLKTTLKQMPNLRSLSILSCEHIKVDDELQALFDKIDDVKLTHDMSNRFAVNQANDLLIALKGYFPTRSSLPPPVNLVNKKHNSPHADSSTQAGGCSQGTKLDTSFANARHSVDLETGTVDANTANPSRSFDVTRIFYSPYDQQHPSIETYRIKTFDSTALVAHMTESQPPFLLSNTQDMQLHPVEIIQTTEDVLSFAQQDQFYAKQSLKLSKQWQKMASLSPAETMTHFHITPSVKVEINYSNRDNLYYIRTIDHVSIDVLVDFLITPLALAPQIQVLSDEIQALVAIFQSFKKGTLQLTKSNPQAVDYVNAMLEQKVGACRHRAVAFKLYMTQNYPNTPVRIVSNDCHMFVEIQHNGHWITANLGGYPAGLNIREDHKPEHIAAPSKPQQSLEFIHPGQKPFLHFFETLLPQNHAMPQEFGLFFQRMVHDYSKCLIEVPTVKLPLLNFNLQTSAKSCQHPLFYANSPDDLICSAPYIQSLTPEIGRLQSGPGGPLYDFLTTDHGASSAPIILINYANFLADDIVRFNSLLDNQRSADGTPIPGNMVIIGMIAPDKPGTYQGADFYSRFSSIQSCPPIASDMPSAFNHRLDSHPAATTINLCHSIAWETHLLGGWILQAGQLHFQAGALAHALRNSQPIHIQNPPNDPSFELFWQQARLHQTVRFPNGEWMGLDPEQQVFCSEGYAWDTLLQTVTFHPEAAPAPLLLNSTLLHRYTGSYEFEAERLTKVPGILQAHTGGIVDVMLTQTMTEDEWGWLLEESLKHKVSLKISLAPGVALPPGFPPYQTIHLPEQATWDQTITVNEPTKLIVSTDCDLTIAKIKRQLNSSAWIIIDVTELNASDLLSKIDGKLIHEASNPTPGYDFYFSETPKVLLKALNAGQQVILCGDFSEELDNSLAPFLCERLRAENPNGLLILVRETPISYMQSVAHKVSEAEKKAEFSEVEIAAIEQENAEAFTRYDFTELTTRIRHMMHSPHNHSDNAWYGFETLPVEIGLNPFNPNTSQQETEDFFNQRRNKIRNALNIAPYVFLAGLTGVGKTTSVEEIFTTSESILFISEKELINWATAQGQKNKILFIDEANLSITQWSQFEGLFHHPRSVIINGDYYPLSEQHQLIFAGNPLSYGDDRRIARLFKRHGNACVFDPLPAAFIHEKIIKPIFERSLVGFAQINLISQELLAVYQFIIKCSQDEVLISPREIQMMALMIRQYLTLFPTDNQVQIQKIAQSYATRIGINLVPSSFLKSFKSKFAHEEMEISGIPLKALSQNSSLFVLTPSRNTVLQQLHDFVSLQSIRRKNPHALNDSQAYGGLGGWVLEGEPGIGKSEMVVHYLLNQGIHEAKIDSAQSHDAHMFYRIPVSMELGTKEKVLLKAFDEGAIVIIDEINSAPMMEQLVNCLLMGKTPAGRRPARLGFAIIGTQNPATMPGRRQSSTALSRRMQTCYLSAYRDEEMLDILKQKGVEYRCADALLAIFLQLKLSKTALSQPAPTFRHLMTAADNWVAAHGKASIADSAPPSPPPSFKLLHDPFRLSDAEVAEFSKQFDILVENFSQQIHQRYLDKQLDRLSFGLITELNSLKLNSLRNPLHENLRQLKTDCLAKINQIEKIAHFNHIIYTTPVLREFMMLLRGLINLIILMICKPVYVVSMSDKKVFEPGLYPTFFCPPKTDITTEAETLSQNIENLIAASC